MRQNLSFIFLLGFLVSGCATGTPLASSTQPVGQSHTSAVEWTPTQPQRTASSTPGRSTITATPQFIFTFDPTTNRTATPETAKACAVNPGVELDFHFPRSAEEVMNYWDTSNISYKDRVINFLSRDGDVRKVTKDLALSFSPHFYYLDVTNDGIQDLIMQGYSVFETLYIFYCDKGQWRVFDSNTPGDPDHIVGVYDLNLNGIPETVSYVTGGTGSGYMAVDIFEWNGWRFSNLRDEPVTIMGASGGPRIQDLNGDGLMEIILVGGACGTAIMDMCFPWRQQTLIFSWNGNQFVLSQTRYTAPEYRYQAIQDADREFLYRNYPKALQLYWSVIEDSSLDWWSPEREKYTKQLWDTRKETPQPVIPTQVPDDQEYDQLSAYAYFRIGLLNLVMGNEEEARKVFNSLYEEYPLGNPGYPYAMLTGYFMDAYSESGDVVSACQAAIQFADKNPSLLAFLNGTNDFQDKIYHPQDICPVHTSP
jgi:hypothetical protein